MFHVKPCIWRPVVSTDRTIAASGIHPCAPGDLMEPSRSGPRPQHEFGASTPPAPCRRLLLTQLDDRPSQGAVPPTAARLGRITCHHESGPDANP